jgi:hypothetical protein
MAKPAEKLAKSLESLKTLQQRGAIAIRSVDLSRTDRERLCRSGFLQEVMKGWYIPARPDETAGESTAWYASFWPFCASYLEKRFGTNWSLSPEQSLLWHAGNRTVPRQLLVRSPRARNQITKFPHATSLLDVRAALPAKMDAVVQDGLRLFSVRSALVSASPAFYAAHPTDARVALSIIRDASEVLELLLEGGRSAVAGRLAGAFRNIGRERAAEDIAKGMRAAGYPVREDDPFEARNLIGTPVGERSPYAQRIRLMWQEMREPIRRVFPAGPGLPAHSARYIKRVSDAYVLDAYHSLSIEGYRVSPDLIERVRRGAWNPELHEADRQHRDALAARGYWQAYQEVLKSVRRVLQGNNPGIVANEDHGAWYRELFAPRVEAGLLRPSDLAGYRNSSVYIRRSMHVPPRAEAVRDAMPVLFELLTEEKEASVRAVLGHFVFVFVHPYLDGNGRVGRYLMNVMLASGGYPWTVLPVQERNAYMTALEEASVSQNIKPFAEFLARQVKKALIGKTASLPSA